ncbi:MAG: hypothetical protein WBE76_01890 [Terracidiphilus sp.]
MFDHPYREAARGLTAALVGHQLGRAGVDRTLKEAAEDPGEGWAEFAERLLTEMGPNLSKSLNPSSFDPSCGRLGTIP